MTSTGNLLVTWSFRKVKKGILNEYKIRVLNTNSVVDNQFQVDHAERVLVTDDNSVGVETVKRK